ncbi:MULTISPECIES: hypothetical protein [unclassified Halomonas]|uniref:hypothetical protein n=1 Tax=unclassified Halomonas TaxID=2609666 RepID=UPI00288874B6|nr:MULTISPECIES: hypothetical protein [unclassified Halomonas]MDT0501755.1 hypothetical protein [Halomonas sp. PAR7]MDT0513415.1 hypothetical protein [Halomonas sp. LES1]MDT0591818.1 hypothetical protein [Halomonas sp. PAR8]
MVTDQKAIEAGIDAGIGRSNEFLGSVPQMDFDEFRNELDSIFMAWPEELSPRFLALFSELAIIAAISRAKYEHPALTRDDLVAYLAHSASFVNSFKHK